MGKMLGDVDFEKRSFVDRPQAARAMSANVEKNEKTKKKKTTGRRSKKTRQKYCVICV